MGAGVEAKSVLADVVVLGAGLEGTLTTSAVWHVEGKLLQ
jgi:hypothetical protein